MSCPPARRRERRKGTETSPHDDENLPALEPAVLREEDRNLEEPSGGSIAEPEGWRRVLCGSSTIKTCIASRLREQIHFIRSPLWSKDRTES